MNESQLPDSSEAQVSLATVAEMTAAGVNRGLYPRWFAAATAVWAGLIAALIAFESPLWLVLFPAGLVGLFLYRRQRGAWVNEVRTVRDLWCVIVGAAVLCLVAVAGIIGWHQFGFFWAPIVAGLAIAAGLFAAMEFSYGAAWANDKRERPS